MARKSEFEQIVESLMDAPWWMSLVVSGIAYILLAAIIPGTMAGSPILSGLSQLSRKLSNYAGQSENLEV